MAKGKDYKQMTVREFIQTELFREHLENALNNLLYGYNELYRKAVATSGEIKKSSLVNLVTEGLLDNTEEFIREYFKVLSKISSRPSGERSVIRKIGDDALHEAIKKLLEKK